MEKPDAINKTTDDHWRKLGWPAIARDEDGHAMGVCALDGHEEWFKEWLLECFNEGWTVTNLALRK